HDAEFEACVDAQAAETVVAEDRDHAVPDLSDSLQCDEGADRLRQHRVGGSPAADEAIKARSIFWVVSADKGHVLDLMRHVLAGVAGNSRLKLARQVLYVLAVKILIDDGLYRRGGVNNFIFCNACDRRAQNHAWDVAAAHHGGQSYRFQALPDFGHILDANPVQLDVLTVGEVCGRARKFLGDFSDDAELLRCGTSAIEADAQHEIFILQFRVRDLSRKLATKVLLTLGINPQPLKAWG